MLALTVTYFRIDRTGARVEFAGGHVIEYRREVEATTPPSIPPLAVVDTTLEPAPASKGLAKCGATRSNVIALPARRSA